MNNQKDPSFYLGVCEDRMDPLKLGRVRVRVMGLHTHDKTDLPTADLPWAYKIQSTTSGAISGIGHAPVGVMEGTWVAIQFIDPDKQMPFVVGTFGGIPSSKNPPLESFELGNADSNVKAVESAGLTDSSGNAVVSGDGTAVNTEAAPTESEKLEEKQNSFATRSAKEFKVSDATVQALKKSERFKSCPYDDGVGVITIGYGSTYLKDNSKVKMTTPCMTEAEAEDLMRYKLEKEFESAVKSAVRVPVTQSMYDSLVHMAYNVGGGGIRGFANTSGLNSAEYQQAAEFMLTYKIRAGSNVEKGLRNRRIYEKNLFLKDGLPGKSNETVAPTPQSVEAKTVVESTATTSVDPASGGYTNKIIEFDNPSVGFKDPNGVYPLKSLLGEPDTNRLARHENIRETIVYVKELAEHKGVEKANGKGTWDQSKTPYNATYPFNNVWQSESGHFLEFDDTAGKERVHLYHRSGTFTETDHNGTQVNRIVGNGYSIMERDGYVHVVGNLHVTVDGATTLLVKDALDIQVNGAVTINCHAAVDIKVAGNATLSAGGDVALTAAGNATMTTGGTFLIKAGGTFAVDAPDIQLNGGSAAGAATVSTIGAIGGSVVADSALAVSTRGDSVAVVYESEDVDAPTATVFKEKMVAEGIATKEEIETPDKKEEEVAPPANKVEEKLLVCGIPAGQTAFSGSEKLSASYTLADLTAKYTRKLKPSQGQTEAQIFCNLKALAENILEPLKSKYPNMIISSGYRDFVPAGGAKTSSHMIGCAADVQFPGLSRAQLYDRALEIQQLVPYDQLLLEYTTNSKGWIHVSFVAGKNRKMHFTMSNHKRVGPVGTITKIA